MADKQQRKLTAEDFDDIADRIAAIAANYRLVAETMRSRGIDELDVFGIDTLEAVTLLRINGPISSANRALLAAKKPSSPKTTYKVTVAEDPEKLAVKKQAAQANKTAAGRKNTKRKP